MPSLDFTLPHWAYWATLVVFPLVAMVMARRSRVEGFALPIGYLVLVTGGLFGLHRLYLRNLWGLLYLPLFAMILVANAQERDARNMQSQANNTVSSAQRVIERVAPEVEGVDERIAALRADIDAAEEGSFGRIRAERMLEKTLANRDQNAARLADMRQKLADAEPQLAAAISARAWWGNVAFAMFLLICAFLAVDAVLLPGMMRRARARLEVRQEAAAPPPGSLAAIEKAAAERLRAEEAQQVQGDFAHVGSDWTGAIDRLSYYTGEFVSYWAVIAVMAYYYEVVARYVFNSPTIWVHEGMYLMFGMQYLIAGAYAALTDAHVKVDVFYADWSPLRKALVDLFTSIFFFIFAGTLLVTGWIFAMDATVVNELSFSEWKIAYWPFKWAIAVGAVLLILQGISKLASDAATVRNSLRGA
ncbi:TRAP transporter small permease subunit [Sediminimonas sp.]|uniref:TRAP transporter small permease subunit n=1 Tax=Sediminimonas sp. TaxID=2823379 RepID=UPI0025D6B7A9|nr:TRAP transporter small permease subunit [Sediminimonas sp.]